MNVKGIKLHKADVIFNDCALTLYIIWLVVTQRKQPGWPIHFYLALVWLNKLYAKAEIKPLVSFNMCLCVWGVAKKPTFTTEQSVVRPC